MTRFHVRSQAVSNKLKQVSITMTQKYRNGEISREEYDQWRYRYPRSEAERNEAERRAMKEENNK